VFFDHIGHDLAQIDAGEALFEAHIGTHVLHI
jgi:hypothetical protein